MSKLVYGLLVFGILNINKPAGVSSRDVVTRVVQVIRKATGQKIKAGHAGTLDPIAEGVLIVCLGKATRLIQYIQQPPKQYVGHFQVDVYSDSADIETEIKPIAFPEKPSLQQLQEQIPQFLGEIDQKPPAYSAISIKGQRAYKLARKGIEFEIEPKRVQIHRLEIVGFEYPRLELLIECGSGTYIRSLGRDLARSVDSDAVMTHLARTAIGSFLQQNAIQLENLDIERLQQALVNPLEVLNGLPSIIVDSEQEERLVNGRFIDPESFDLVPTELPQELIAVSQDHQLVAILEPINGQLKPKLNFR